jgi:hypothetical protein
VVSVVKSISELKIALEQLPKLIKEQFLLYLKNNEPRYSDDKDLLEQLFSLKDNKDIFNLILKNQLPLTGSLELKQHHIYDESTEEAQLYSFQTKHVYYKLAKVMEDSAYFKKIQVMVNLFANILSLQVLMQPSNISDRSDQFNLARLKAEGVLNELPYGKNDPEEISNYHQRLIKAKRILKEALEYHNQDMLVYKNTHDYNRLAFEEVLKRLRDDLKEAYALYQDNRYFANIRESHPWHGLINNICVVFDLHSFNQDPSKGQLELNNESLSALFKLYEASQIEAYQTVESDYKNLYHQASKSLSMAEERIQSLQTLTISTNPLARCSLFASRLAQGQIAMEQAVIRFKEQAASPSNSNQGSVLAVYSHWLSLQGAGQKDKLQDSNDFSLRLENT